MVVLSSMVTTRFGVADAPKDLKEDTYGWAQKSGALELRGELGDVFIILAGVTHKT